MECIGLLKGYRADEGQRNSCCRLAALAKGLPGNEHSKKQLFLLTKNTCLVRIEPTGVHHDTHISRSCSVQV